MGVFSAACVVIANMIGTGVFTSLGFQLLAIRDPFAVLMLWCVGAVLALTGALVYGELGAAMPRSGGEYHYLSQIYSPAVGFMSGWVSVTVGFAAPAALSCMAFGSYLNRIMPSVSPVILALSILAVTTAVHCLGFRGGILFQDAFTVIKIALILVFIVFGLFMTGHRIPVSFLPQTSSMKTILGSAFAVSLIYVSYSYSGWNASAYVTGELDQPQKRLPVSLWTGTLIVALLYIGLNAAFLATAPMADMAGQVDVAFVPARRLFGPTGAAVMAAIIAVLLVSFVSSMVFVGPRVTQVMGEDSRLFRVFAKKSAGGLPVTAILFQSLISLVLIVTSSFETVLTYIGFTLNLFTWLAVAGIFVHRARYPSITRPYKTWGFPFTPIVFIVFLTWMQVYLIMKRPVQACLGTVTALLGLGVYAIDRRLSKKRPTVK
jgi:APA family basic amino acid/polyamine antiporter